MLRRSAIAALSLVLATCTTEPSATVVQVAFRSNTYAMIVGDTATVVATPIDQHGNPVPGRTVTWSAADAAIASVSAGGLVTAVAAGTSTVTATCDGMSGTVAVSVSAASDAGELFAPSTPVLAVGAGPGPVLRLAYAVPPDHL